MISKTSMSTAACLLLLSAGVQSQQSTSEQNPFFTAQAPKHRKKHSQGQTTNIKATSPGQSGFTFRNGQGGGLTLHGGQSAFLSSPLAWTSSNDKRLHTTIEFKDPRHGDFYTLRILTNGEIRITTQEGKDLAVVKPGKGMNWTNAMTGQKVIVVRGSPKKQRASLGVVVGSVPPALAAYIDEDLDDKVLVLESRAGGAAKKAGLRKHDILMEVDGVTELSANKLAKLIGAKKAGSKIDVVVLRRGKRMSFTVALGAKVVSPRTGYLRNGSPLSSFGSAKDLLLTQPKQNARYWIDPNAQKINPLSVWEYANIAATPKTASGKSAKRKSVETSIESLLQDLREQRKRIDETLDKLSKIELMQTGKKSSGR